MLEKEGRPGKNEILDAKRTPWSALWLALLRLMDDRGFFFPCCCCCCWVGMIVRYLKRNQ